MTAIAHTRRADGAPAPIEPEAPAVLRIDVADAVAQADAAPVRAQPIPKRTSLDELLLEEARKCAAARDEQWPPRRELIGAALREVSRQEYWRDVAELAARDRAVEAREAEQALARMIGLYQGARQDRHDLLGIVFELVGYAALKLGVDPKPDLVLKRIRALGSGHLVPGPIPEALGGERRRSPGA